MRPSPLTVMELAERMKLRADRGFRVSPATALVIEALRYYAAALAPEADIFKVERWDHKKLDVQEIVASSSLIRIGKAAFDAAVEQYPGERLTFRQAARIIGKAGPGEDLD